MLVCTRALQQAHAHNDEGARALRTGAYGKLAYGETT